VSVNWTSIIFVKLLNCYCTAEWSDGILMNCWYPLVTYPCSIDLGATTKSHCQQSVNNHCEAAILVWYSQMVRLYYYELLISSSNISLLHGYWCHNWKCATTERLRSLWSCSIGMVQPNSQIVLLWSIDIFQHHFFLAWILVPINGMSTIFLKRLNWYGRPEWSDCTCMNYWHPLVIYLCNMDIGATTKWVCQLSINDLAE
jgi:hypothetical protein